MSTPRELLVSAAATLSAAGIDSPQTDARLLLAHVLRTEPSRLLLVDSVADETAETFDSLVARRAERVPLQHLTGTSWFRHVELQVGPGVFVPRPETEVMTGWAVDRLIEMTLRGQTPVVVELCAGSGAIAKSLAFEVPGLDLRALEISEEAARWAERNLVGTGVDLLTLDLNDAPSAWDGTVDLVIANPPYIPFEAYESVTPEARDHDPMVALFSGDDGLDAMRDLARVAARLLKDDGLVCAEHAEVQVESAQEVFVRQGDFTAVRDHRDLSARPRFVTATRVARGPHG